MKNLWSRYGIGGSALGLATGAVLLYKAHRQRVEEDRCNRVDDWLLGLFRPDSKAETR